MDSLGRTTVKIFVVKPTHPELFLCRSFNLMSFRNNVRLPYMIKSLSCLCLIISTAWRFLLCRASLPSVMKNFYFIIT